jgi:hypothetical protein
MLTYTMVVICGNFLDTENFLNKSTLKMTNWQIYHTSSGGKNSIFLRRRSVLAVNASKSGAGEVPLLSHRPSATQKNHPFFS